MALTKEGIASMENQVGLITGDANRISSTIDSVSTRLKNDTNYQIFVSGTEIGKELNEKLEKVVSVTKSLTENEVQNIIKISNQFLELQENLNSKGVS